VVEHPTCNRWHAERLLELAVDASPLGEELVSMAKSLEETPECFLAAGSSCLMAESLGMELAALGHGGVPFPSEKLLHFERYSAKCNAFGQHYPQEAAFKWEFHVLTKKMWVQTTRDVADFEKVVKTLALYQPLGTPEIVCIRGSTFLAQESLVFAHFVWGHLVPVFTALLKARHLHWSTQLVFTDDPFMKPRSSWLAFYGMFFDRLPAFESDCRRATKVIDLIEHTPIFSHFMEHPEKDATVFEKEPWEQHFADCAWRPVLNRIAHSRLQIEPYRLMNVLYLGRGVQGAVQRRVETLAKRDLLNRNEVIQAISSAVGDRARLLTETTDKPWYEQVKLFATTDFLIGLHGSAIASQEVWMPDGSILVSVMSRSICECRWAYCAAANPERSFLYVIATTDDVSCDLGGRWLAAGRVGPFEPPELHFPYDIAELVNMTHQNELWDYTRHLDPTQIAKGLEVALNPSPEDAQKPLSERFEAWALENGHKKGCGGLALQMVDSARSSTGEYGPPGLKL